MIGVIVALLVAYAGSQKNHLEPGFSNIKTYRYRYNGLIMNGLPEEEFQKSGLKLTCDVEVSRVSQEEHILKVLSPRVEEYNGIWTRDRFIEVPKLTHQIGQCFTQLFKFEYRRGQVGNIYAPKDIPILCVNIVKGILNLFPMTIKESGHVYELHEPRIEGTCLTKYIIQEDRENNQATVFQTRDLNNCTDKVVKNIGMAYVRPCPTCPVKTKNVRGTVALTQKLKYIDSGALIIRAESQQVYEISPFNEPDGTAVMEARQNLTLIETKHNQERIPEIQLENHRNLYYRFAEDLPQMALHLIKPERLEAKFAQVLLQLMKQNQLQVRVETPGKFLELIELSRMMTLENLESLWKQFADRRESRGWFLNAVAAAGTTNTFLFLKQRIQNEELDTMSSITLVLAFHLTKPDRPTLRAAADLMASPGVQKSLLLHKLAHLAYGSMVCRYCLTSSPCPVEVLQPLHDLATAAANKNHEEDIVLALKAIGNAGDPASFKYIKRFLPGASTAAYTFPERIHANAILALRKIARKEAAKVRETVFQIFLDHSLLPWIRMLACMVFFETKPALPAVMAMANVLQRENSLQVASFAYSHMKVLAAGGIPQLENLATACSISMKLLSPRFDQRSLRYSKVIQITGYNANYRTGAIGRLYLNIPTSPALPSAMVAKIRGYYATSAMDIVEVAFRSQGLTDLLRGQDAAFAQYSSFKKLKEFGKLLQGWKELPSGQPLLFSYVKLFSHEIAYGSVDKELLQPIMKFLMKPGEMQVLLQQMITLFQKGLTSKLTHPVLVAELRHMVPTVVGFPLEFGLNSASIMHAAANVKGQISAPLTGTFRPEQLLEAKIQLSTDIDISVYTHAVVTMGINTPHFQNGLEFHAKFNASLPVKFDARIDMKEESLKFETIPIQETELFAARTKLYAISRNMDEPDSTKKSPVLPQVAGPDVFNEQWKPSESERGLKHGGIKHTMSYGRMSQRYAYGENQYQEGERTCSENVCVKLVGYRTCLTMNSCNTAIFRKTYLRTFVEERDVKLAVRPEIAGTKIQLEIQGASKVDSKATWPERFEEEQQHKGRLMRASNPPGLVAVLRTIRDDERLTWFHLALRADLHSSKPTVQVVVSDFKGSRQMKLCADVSILDSQRAEGALKWGQDCQDYKIATQIAYGQYGGHPAMQFKLKWAKIPSVVQAAARRLLTYIPGTAYMLGFIQKQQKNPTQEASVVVALTSPQSCDLVFRLPDITIYDTDMMLPFPLPVGQPTEAMQPHAWSFISDAPPAILENLKAHCSVSQDTVSTFNDVRFNCTMPENGYRILTQDCSSELKFQVAERNPGNPYEGKIVHITLANQEIEMYTSNRVIKLRINGTEIPTATLPYSSRSEIFILITHQRDGFVLKAPEAGIDRLYYDGHILKIKVDFWMTGRTCGICGRGDADCYLEYKMPNGSVAKDAISFVRSWTLPQDAFARAKAQISLDQKLKHN